MSILTILQLVVGVLGAAKDLQSIIDDLRAQGHPDDKPLAPEHVARVQAAFQNMNLQASSALWDETHAPE